MQDKDKQSEANKCCRRKKTRIDLDLSATIILVKEQQRQCKAIQMHKKTHKERDFASVDSKTWEYYFQEKFKNEMEIGVPPRSNKENAFEEEEQTYEEFMQVVIELQNKKAPGPDEVGKELTKNEGEHLLQEIYRLLLAIWKEKSMPKEWEEGWITPILKKENPTKCVSYRCITLFNTAYKILTTIVRRSITKHRNQNRRYLGKIDQPQMQFIY